MKRPSKKKPELEMLDTYDFSRGVRGKYAKPYTAGTNRRKAMATTGPRYSKEEFARRGDAIYERDIRPSVSAANEDDFVAIDIETGAYEIDADELTVSDRLLARLPGAQVWLRRVSSRYARRFASR
jgi:hypothetical protein